MSGFCSPDLYLVYQASFILGNETIPTFILQVLINLESFLVLMFQSSLFFQGNLGLRNKL
jgi:hypothetical protein